MTSAHIYIYRERERERDLMKIKYPSSTTTNNTIMHTYYTCIYITVTP